MLQAYIDDSKQDTPGLYVLAGYVADESKWLDFDREWKEVLAGPPRLHHLKTSDIFQTRNRKSVFWGWSREEVDARVLRLAIAVNKHVLASIQTAIRKEDFANILGGLPSDDPSMNRPYPFLFFSIVQGLVSRLDSLGVSDKVEFCFDIQPDEKMQTLRRVFEIAKPMYQGWLGKRIAGEPRFEDDEEVTPLQAADLMAWHFRKNLAEHEQGRTFTSEVWTELLNAPHRVTGLWDRNILREFHRGASLRHQLLRCRPIPMTVPDPSSFLRDNLAGLSRIHL
jgi:Protein of unknown function (DUF3800)